MDPRQPATTHILPGNPPVEVRLRRHRRAKRFSLRVSRADGRVSLSLPIWAPEAEALAFLRAREGWLRANLDKAPTVQQARIGAALPVLGVPTPVIEGSGRVAQLVDGRLQVPPGPRQGPRLKALLMSIAREELAEAVVRHARVIGKTPGKLALRDPRSRWGSCSSRGDLMFSFRLIMAPREILDYVAAHEVAHLAEMNHSGRFWAVCRKLCPETDAHRAWLKTHGPDLLAWKFDGDPS